MNWWSKIAILLVVFISAVWKIKILSPITFQPVDMTGKVVIVTGGSAGIGLETVRILYNWNATVVMPVRDISKGKAARNSITGGISSDRIDLMELDLISFKSVRSFAAAVSNKYKLIDALILNAGMHGADHSVMTEDGVETTYQVNYLSHFLLTRLLIRSVARIVHVSSSMHYIGVIDRIAYSDAVRNNDVSKVLVNGNELGGSFARMGMSSYSDTKLMNVVFSNALDRHIKQSNLLDHHPVSSVSIHPGFVLSDIDRGSSIEPLMRAFRTLVARPTRDGAITQVTAATSPKVISVGGGLYFEDHCIMSGCTQCLFCSLGPNGVGVKPHRSATDLDDQEWLWNTSSVIVGLPYGL